jgi:hypothetical protein
VTSRRQLLKGLAAGTLGLTSYGALCENIVSGPQVGDALSHMNDRVSRVERRTSEVNRLDSLSHNLGLMLAGEFRSGNGVEPGAGFSGMRMGYPGFSYDSETWNLVGIENDALQFGVRASDGKALAGGGAVIIDADGISIEQGSGDVNAIKFIDSSDDFLLGKVQTSMVGTSPNRAGVALLYANAEGTGAAKVSITAAVPGGITPSTQIDVSNNGDILFIGYPKWTTTTAPSTPAGGYAYVYVKSSDDMLYFKNDVGVEHHVAAGKPYTQKSLANTTETSIFEQTIAANALGTNGSIHAPIPYRIANGTGFNQTIRWRLYYDDTVLIDYTTPNIASDANPYEGLAWFQMYNTGISSGSNAQRAQLRLDLAAAAAVGSAATTGGTYNVTIGGTASEDSTAAKVLKLTVTLSANGGTAPSFRSGGAAPLGPYAL